MAQKALKRIKRAPKPLPPFNPYSRAELSHWLPPESVFEGRSGVLTRQGRKELAAANNPAIEDKRMAKKNPYGNAPTSLTTGLLPVARYVRPSFASQPGPADPGIKPYSQLIDPQLWRLADGGDHVAMYELERRGVDHLRPARPNPADNLDHLPPKIRKYILHIAKINNEENFPNDVKDKRLKKDIDTAMRMLKNGQARVNPHEPIPGDVLQFFGIARNNMGGFWEGDNPFEYGRRMHIFALRRMKEGKTEAQIRRELRDRLGLNDYYIDRYINMAKDSFAEEQSAKTNPTASPQARGFTFMHSDMNEEWANWALARQGIQSRHNPKYTYRAEKEGKGYIVFVNGPDGETAYRVRGVKGGKKAAIDEVKREREHLRRGTGFGDWGSL
jgi:hypothetical protein